MHLRGSIRVHIMSNDELVSYWIGPYGVLVPQGLKSVVAKDGGNTRYFDGTETEKFVVSLKGGPMTKYKYRAKYARISEYGHWIYGKKAAKVDKPAKNTTKRTPKVSVGKGITKPKPTKTKAATKSKPKKKEPIADDDR